MNFIKTEIDGVVIVEPRVFDDERGYFFESYNDIILVCKEEYFKRISRYPSYKA